MEIVATTGNSTWMDPDSNQYFLLNIYADCDKSIPITNGNRLEDSRTIPNVSLVSCICSGQATDVVPQYVQVLTFVAALLESENVLLHLFWRFFENMFNINKDKILTENKL